MGTQSTWGSVVGQPVVMQFLIATSLFASAAAQLVVYPNGAVAPFDPANAAATKGHFAALSEAGANVNPYFTHAQDFAVPAPVVYAGYPYGLYARKKRSADPQTLGADGLVTYPNGAIAPFDPNVALATAAHFQAKAAHGSWFPLEGAASVHPAAVPAYPYGIYGRKKRESDPQVLLAGAYGAYPYLVTGMPVFLTVFHSPLWLDTPTVPLSHWNPQLLLRLELSTLLLLLKLAARNVRLILRSSLL